jgi:hypothetical protein
MRCTCGEVDLLDGWDAVLSGTVHRLNSPCYQMQIETPEVHEVDVMPGMVIRPGDVLVIACDEKHLELSRAQSLRDALMTRMPGLADVVVLAAPLTIGAVYRRDRDVE